MQNRDNIPQVFNASNGIKSRIKLPRYNAFIKMNEFKFTDHYAKDRRDRIDSFELDPENIPTDKYEIAQKRLRQAAKHLAYNVMDKTSTKPENNTTLVIIFPYFSIITDGKEILPNIKIDKIEGNCFFAIADAKNQTAITIMLTKNDVTNGEIRTKAKEHAKRMARNNDVDMVEFSKNQKYELMFLTSDALPGFGANKPKAIVDLDMPQEEFDKIYRPISVSSVNAKHFPENVEQKEEKPETTDFVGRLDTTNIKSLPAKESKEMVLSPGASLTYYNVNKELVEKTIKTVESTGRGLDTVITVIFTDNSLKRFKNNDTFIVSPAIENATNIKKKQALGADAASYVKYLGKIYEIGEYAGSRYSDKKARKFVRIWATQFIEA